MDHQMDTILRMLILKNYNYKKNRTMKTHLITFSSLILILVVITGIAFIKANTITYIVLSVVFSGFLYGLIYKMIKPLI